MERKKHIKHINFGENSMTLKNGNMPAMPLGEYKLIEAVQLEGAEEGIMIDKYVDAYGLTKREHFAGLAMQGLLSNSHLSEVHGIANEDVIAESLSKADALLEALEKDNEL